MKKSLLICAGCYAGGVIFLLNEQWTASMLLLIASLGWAFVVRKDFKE